MELPGRESGHEVLGALWARQKIEHLMNQDWAGIQGGSPRTEIKEEITDLGLKFRLVTQFTSFVAVEWMVITEGGEARTVPVPVAMPEGVTYEGVFGADYARRPAGTSRGLFLSQTAAVMAGGYGAAGPAGPAGATRAEQPASEGWVDYRIGLGEPAGMTPEEKREFRVKNRLAAELHGLAEKVTSEGQDGNLTIGDIEVKGGLVEVAIWLTVSLYMYRRLGVGYLRVVADVGLQQRVLPVADEVGRAGSSLLLPPASLLVG